MASRPQHARRTEYSVQGARLSTARLWGRGLALAALIVGPWVVIAALVALCVAAF